MPKVNPGVVSTPQAVLSIGTTNNSSDVCLVYDSGRGMLLLKENGDFYLNDELTTDNSAIVEFIKNWMTQYKQLAKGSINFTRGK